MGTKLSLALQLANLTIIISSCSCLQAKIKAGKKKKLKSESVKKKIGQMKQKPSYRTVLLAWTGLCSGILPMALRSTPHQSMASSISSLVTLSPKWLYVQWLVKVLTLLGHFSYFIAGGELSLDLHNMPTTLKMLNIFYFETNKEIRQKL